MPARMVKSVDEEKQESVYTVESLGALNLVAGESDYRDPFDVSPEEVKTMRGTDAVFKRRITNELKKARVGTGASSKQVDGREITGYDTFGVVHPPYNLDYLAKLYEKSSPHKAAVDAKVANIVGLGYKFVETPKTRRALEDIADNEAKTKTVRRALDIHKEELVETFEGFNQEDTFTETLVKVWCDYETTGNGYLEIGRKRDGTIGYLGHIPSQTMRVRRKRDGFVQISGDKAQFFRHFGEKSTSNPLGGGKPNEVIHFKRYSPTSSFYGVPDIIAAQQAVAGNEFAARFNLDYFENKAVPRHVIILKGANLGVKAQEQLLQFFETGLKGQNHRSLFIPLPGDTEDGKVEFKIEAVENGVQDASFVNYRRANLSDILMVHRVPISKISIAEGASLAVARDADKTFKEQVCEPEQKVAEKKLNKIVKELTDAFEMDLNEMSLTDADTQSKIDERYVKTGVKVPNEIRAAQGLQGIKGGEERVDLNAKDKISQAQAEAKAEGNRERDSQRSANGSDSNGESRNPKGEGRQQG